jgi:hypothetical protein
MGLQRDYFSVRHGKNIEDIETARTAEKMKGLYFGSGHELLSPEEITIDTSKTMG